MHKYFFIALASAISFNTFAAHHIQQKRYTKKELLTVNQLWRGVAKKVRSQAINPNNPDAKSGFVFDGNTFTAFITQDTINTILPATLADKSLHGKSITLKRAIFKDVLYCDLPLLAPIKNELIAGKIKIFAQPAAVPAPQTEKKSLKILVHGLAQGPAASAAVCIAKESPLRAAQRFAKGPENDKGFNFKRTVK